MSLPSYSVADVLGWTGGRLVNGEALGGLEATIRIEKPSVLKSSGPRDIAFFFSRAYEQELATASAGVLITAEPFVKPMEAASLPFWRRTAVIACRDPYWAMAFISERLAPGLSTVAHVPHGGGREGKPEIHPTAVIAEDVRMGPGVRVGAYCVVEKGSEIGAGSVLYARVFVGPDVKIGEDCVLFPGVTVYEEARIGNRVRLHAGTVIGADGFGYAPQRSGTEVLGHQKIYHLGRVRIGDDVEIGANSCVDRGTFGETVIESMAKIDNLVQVGHNARVGQGAVICGSAALAGNSSIGKFALVGGLTGVSNQVHVGDGASVAAMTLVSKDVGKGGTAVGNPQRDHKEFFRIHAMLSRMLAERKAERKSK